MATSSSSTSRQAIPRALPPLPELSGPRDAARRKLRDDRFGPERHISQCLCRARANVGVVGLNRLDEARRGFGSQVSQKKDISLPVTILMGLKRSNQPRDVVGPDRVNRRLDLGMSQKPRASAASSVVGMRNHRAGRIAKADTAAANRLIKERVEKVYPPNITRAMIAYPPSPGASLGSVNRQTITHNARMNVSTETTKAVFRTGLIVIRRPCQSQYTSHALVSATGGLFAATGGRAATLQMDRVGGYLDILRFGRVG